MICTYESTSTVKSKNRRKRLFDTLDDVLKLAEEKRGKANVTDKTKQAWCRIAISAVEAYGGLLKDCEIEEIEERLDKLEHGFVDCGIVEQQPKVFAKGE